MKTPKDTHLLQSRFIYFTCCCKLATFQVHSSKQPIIRGDLTSPDSWMTGYGNIAKTKQDDSWIKYVFSLMPPPRQKNNLEWPFQLGFIELIPKYWRSSIRNTFGLFEKHFWKRMSQKSPVIYLRPESLGIFLRNEHQPSFLGSSAFKAQPKSGAKLTKSIYYTIQCILKFRLEAGYRRH